LFEQQVEAAAERIAVECAAERLTYGELNERANRLAHYLRELGVGADARVALCLERGIEMVIAMLAVLKAGGGYVPLDPAYPAERLSFMLADCEPCAVLVDAASRAALSQCAPALPVIEMDRAVLWAARPSSNPRRESVGLTAQHLAYVIYTSGSSGAPKGVMIEHRNLTRLFAATRAWFDFSASDVWSAFHSYAFDFSVWEIWGALLHGARLVVVPLATARAPEQFLQLVCHAGITVLNQTPSAFHQLIAAQGRAALPHRLRYVIFGGEALDESMLEPWYAQPANRATQLVNMYGITETTVHVTWRALEARDAIRRSGSIGVAIPDLGVRVLDAHGAPVPAGIPGEIYVTGAGVARGYLHRPELTA
jgi:amino acid adenylation domain-containing protein